MGVKRLGKSIYRTLFANRFSYKLNTFLLECSLHGLGILNYENHRLSGERHFVGVTLRRWLRGIDRPVFVDVGANTGVYSSMLIDAFPDCRLVAVEPHPSNFQRLRDALPPQVETIQAAVGAEQTELKLFDRADMDGSSHASLYKEVITQLHQQTTVECRVDVLPLDQIAADACVSNIDLLKIDTEGHELEVLKGAAELLRSHSVSFIHLEFNEMNVYSRVFFRDLRDLLSDFKFYRLLPRSMIQIPDTPLKSELFAFQNVICVRRDRAPLLAA